MTPVKRGWNWNTFFCCLSLYMLARQSDLCLLIGYLAGHMALIYQDSPLCPCKKKNNNCLGHAIKKLWPGFSVKIRSILSFFSFLFCLFFSCFHGSLGLIKMPSKISCLRNLLGLVGEPIVFSNKVAKFDWLILTGHLCSAFRHRLRIQLHTFSRLKSRNVWLYNINYFLLATYYIWFTQRLLRPKFRQFTQLTFPKC